MKSILTFVQRLESKIGVWQVTSFLILANIWWVITLQAINSRFVALTGYALPDLQNGAFAPQITLEGFQTQIAAYNDAAHGVYLSFFILDNVVPFIAFAPFTLLWVYLLKHQPNRIAKWLLSSPLTLLPIGIGVFDCWENLFYLAAIQQAPASGTQTLIQAGFAFGFIKAICVQATFFSTPLLLISHLVSVFQRYRMARATG